MKAFFLTLLGLLLSVAIVRYAQGLDVNSVSHFVSTLLELPPDIKGEFQIVIDASQSFVTSLEQLKMVATSGDNIFKVVESFFDSIAALLNIPFAFMEFLVALVKQLLKSLRAVFNLLFGPVVVPID